MPYSIVLGSDDRYIPKGEWDSATKTVWDLVFRKRPDSFYKACLVSRKGEIDLGLVAFEDYSGWLAIPNPTYAHPNVKRFSQRGFYTRRAAGEYLMRKQGFRDPEDW